MFGIVTTKNLYFCEIKRIENITYTDNKNKYYYSDESYYILAYRLQLGYFEDIYTGTIYKNKSSNLEDGEYFIYWNKPIFTNKKFLGNNDLKHILSDEKSLRINNNILSKKLTKN